MRVTVVGTGYVGLVTGTCLAEAGHSVKCVDIDLAKVESMKAGKIPIYEPGLEPLFLKNIELNNLSFTSSLKDGIKEAQIIFLALPTPPSEDGSADLSHILDVADKLGDLLSEYVVIVDKSTVPVGTADKIKTAIKQKTNVEFDVVSNPEFLREGHAVQDFQNPDRIVIGSSSDTAKSLMQELYSAMSSNDQIIMMDERSAEMTKYVANAFLATKISFMNQMANLAEILGANIDSVKAGVGSDVRIGSQFLNAGIGYGGSCFPKDVSALLHIGETNGYELDILESVAIVNRIQKTRIVIKIRKYFDDNLVGKKFCLWGLAFKPDTDDIREAPSIIIANELTEAGAAVVAYDPQAVENVKKFYPDLDISYASDKYSALDGCDALIVATEWSEFREADFQEIVTNLKNPVIFDGRNIYNPEKVASAGIYYESIGRPLIEQSR